MNNKPYSSQDILNNVYDGASGNLRVINVDGSGEAGTSDYEQLENRPQINGITLNGNKTSDELGLQPIPEVISSGGSVGYIPVLSGGKTYKFSQELITLSIGSITDTQAEDTILFSAGGVFVPPTSVSMYFESGYFDDEIWDWQTGSKLLSLSGSGGVLSYAPDSVEWARKYEWDNEQRIYLSGGSIVALCSGTTWTVSAHNLGYYFWRNSWDEDNEEVISSGTINGLFASSTDCGETWTFGGATIPWVEGNDDNYGTNSGYGSACNVDHDGSITPCAVIIPPGIELVGSSKIELQFNHHYEMNVANGGIIIAERFTPEVSE